MISYIKGTTEYIGENYAIIENNNIGYQVFLSGNVLEKLSVGKDTKIYTYMKVSEDNISLYGFLSLEDISVFNLLISVSGVGPKLALSILNTLSPKEIMLAIVTDDFEKLNKCHGVGKKTAQRLALELKDKIKSKENLSADSSQISTTNMTEKQDAIDALTALGYNRNESMKTVFEIALPEMKTEEIIKLALKKLANIR